MARTIEQIVASAILEKATTEIEIGDKVYKLADPSIATLILVSEIVSTLPIIEKGIPKEQKVYYAIHYAKDYKPLGDICAILILGAKGLIEEREIIEEKRILGVFKRRTTRKVIVDKQAELAQLILENVSPTKIYDCIVQRLQDMEVGSFFAITTSLSEANLLKPTKEVVEP